MAKRRQQRRGKSATDRPATHLAARWGHRAPPPNSRARLWGFRLAAMLLVPVLVLGGAELALRLASYGHPTGFFVHRHVAGREVIVENEKFSARFLGRNLVK